MSKPDSLQLQGDLDGISLQKALLAEQNLSETILESKESKSVGFEEKEYAPFRIRLTERSIPSTPAAYCIEAF